MNENKRNMNKGKNKPFGRNDAYLLLGMVLLELLQHSTKIK